MYNSKPVALIVSGSNEWMERCADTFIEHDFDVHTASQGTEAVELLRRQHYDAAVAEDSLPDLGVVEMVLYASELAPAMQLFVAGDKLARFDRVFERCGVDLAGPPDVLLEDLGEMLESDAETESPKAGS